jgi:hypothetical protein
MSAEPAQFGFPMVLWSYSRPGRWNDVIDGERRRRRPVAVPGTDAVLSNTWSSPPKNFIGVGPARRSAACQQNNCASLAEPSRLGGRNSGRRRPTPAVEAQRLAVTPRRQPMPPQRQFDSEEIAILVKRGKGSLAMEIPLVRGSCRGVPPSRKTPRQR